MQYKSFIQPSINEIPQFLQSSISKKQAKKEKNISLMALTQMQKRVHW